MAIRKIKLPDDTTVDINDSRIHLYRGMTGTAAKTSSPYYSSRWDVTDDTVTAYEDGMIVWLEVPIAGNGSYGTCLQINSLGYKPVVYNVSSMISTRYSVGSMVLACYNATQTAKAYFNSSSATTVTGCWQVMDYDSNTTSISNLYHPRGTRVVTGGQLKRYVLCVEANETGIIPLNYTGTTATGKTMTTEAFDPTREILYYTTDATVAAGDPVALSGCFYSNTSVDARYTFNSGKTLTENKELYMVMDVQSDGRLCKLASTPWSQTLPTTNDGHVYMLLGYTYDTYRIELYPHHPMFYHDGTSLKIWHGTISGGASTLSDLTDTTISSLADGQVLTYDSSSSKWKNAAPKEGLFVCEMTYSGSTYSCDKTWEEIYAAYQDGKLPILVYNYEIYQCSNIGDTFGAFSLSMAIDYLSLQRTAIQMFYYDGSGDLFPSGWTHHDISSDPFSASDKTKLDGIATGAEVNVQSDWSIADSTSDAYIANKPIIPDDLNDLTDTAISSPSDGQVLTYDSTSSKWINAASSGGSGVQTLTSPVRIWDLDPGLYIIPAPCTIYYNGATSTTSATINGGGILNVFWQNSNTNKSWYAFTTDYSSASTSAPKYLCGGGTTSSSGFKTVVEWVEPSGSSTGRGLSTFLGIDNWNTANMSLNAILNSYCVANGIQILTLQTTTTDLPSGVTIAAETKSLVFTHNAIRTKGSSYNNEYGIRQDFYIPSLNKHYYRIIQYTSSGSTPNTSIPNCDSNGWVEVIETYPALTGNAGKVLAVNSGATGVEWVSQSGGGGGLSNYDFTHTANSTVTTSVTVTYAANTRGSRMVSTSADLSVSFAVNNSSDNYLWIKNTGSSDIDITVDSVTYNSNSVSNVYMPYDGISIPAGYTCEVGIVCNVDGAFITSRNDLAL